MATHSHAAKMAKHVVIGGGSGFIGTALKKVLIQRGDKVTIVSRFPGQDRITWQQLQQNGLPQCDAVINLAGKHILDMTRRWTQAYRDELVASRVGTTKLLVDAMNHSATPPELFISTAGKCFYGAGEDYPNHDPIEVDEYSTPIASDYPAKLVRQWEAAADGVDKSKIRHAKLRIGIVLAASDRATGHHRGQTKKPWRLQTSRGIFPLMRSAFALGLGATFGDGKQPFPWVHIDDVVQIIIKTIDDKNMAGLFNAVSPGIVDNKKFSTLLAKKLKRPLLFSIPSWLVTAIVGSERSSILLRGQLVKPKRTLTFGYEFLYPDIETALGSLI